MEVAGAASEDSMTDHLFRSRIVPAMLLCCALAASCRSSNVKQIAGRKVEVERDGACRAIDLASFEGIEEPEVRYIVATGQIKADELANITDQGHRTVRMLLRYHTDWWDGDRDLESKDRQRAEVKGLGPRQKLGETFEYETTFRTNADFHTAKRFCHIFQLKATEGDRGAPLVTLSLVDRGHGHVQVWSGKASGPREVRRFEWTPGKWEHVRIRIRTSTSDEGEVTASVNGDELQGVRGVAVFRPDADDYRPKWGLYRGVGPDTPLGEDWIEHRDVTARRLAERPRAPGATDARAESGSWAG